jgi:polysaccharide deacetylase family protein (PEP-CTERM system associated)
LDKGETKPELIFTVDVEDWANSSLGLERPITDRFLVGLDKILSLLDRAGGRGTFFVLGAAAEKFPQAARAIAAAGHDVGAHGFAHAPVYAFEREGFREDLRRVGGTLADITGAQPVYYRAPDFSINAASLWALDVLAEEGYVADSSIFPIKGRRYGIPWWPREPRDVELPGGRRIVELPLPTLAFPGMRVPAAGGGYSRVMPYGILKAVLAKGAPSGKPRVLYCHPYELDDGEIAAYRHEMSFKTRFSQGVGRRGMYSKLKKVLAQFKAISVHEYITTYKISIYEIPQDVVTAENGGTRGE